jgi:hypothetical protein
MEALCSRCFSCDQTLSVEFVVREEGHPHGHAAHNMAYALSWIGRCPHGGQAQIERYDHDCYSTRMDEPPEGKAWFQIERRQADQLFALLRNRCGRPLDGSCKCAVHEALRAAFRTLPYRTDGPAHISTDFVDGDPPRLAVTGVRFLDPDRFQLALQLALGAHAGQVRTDTQIPYISHPLGVASLVMEDGGSDDETAAALLHDAVEDGGPEYVRWIRDALGEHVVSIVLECSDSVVPPGADKPPWRERKDSYLASIARKAPEAIRVTTADKLHNARAIVADLHDIGPGVFERFNAKREGTLWYYGAVADKLAKHPAARPRLLEELRRAVTKMQAWP